MAYITGTYFAPMSRSTGRNFKLVGYWLNSNSGNCVENSSSEIRCRLDSHCSQQGAQLNAVEWDCANSANPIRLGLWRAIRRLVCNKCQPRPMSMSFMHLDDFMTQALAPCSCLSRSGLDGLIVASLRHLCTDQNKANQMILRLAEAGKHVLAEDGVCRSCCHASTKALIQKKRLLIAS